MIIYNGKIHLKLPEPVEAVVVDSSVVGVSGVVGEGPGVVLISVAEQIGSKLTFMPTPHRPTPLLIFMYPSSPQPVLQEFFISQ